MRETVARIAKPAMIALAGAAAMFSAASPASAMPIVDAVSRAPQRVTLEVPPAVANVPLTAVGSVAGHVGQ